MPMINKSDLISTLYRNLRPIIAAAILLAGSRPVLADTTCALMLGGFRNDCVVVDAHGKTIRPAPMMSLHSGDKIIQPSGVDGIVIKCSPFTSAKKLSATTMEIVFQPPAEKNSVFKELKSFLGFEKDSHQRRTAGTRAIFGEEGDVFVPQPGYWATLLPDETVEFSCDRTGFKTIVVRDPSDAEVFSRAFGEGTSIALTPREIKMRPSETYYWGIEIRGVPRSIETHAMKLLADDWAALTTSDLRKLAEEQVGSPETKLRMAAYCQFISDTYPKDVDMYWKSCQILKELDETTLTPDEKVLDQLLRDRWIQHVQAQMTAGNK
jgi:hypothetical protein